MRDPNYIAAWSDSLTIRIHLEEARPFSEAFPAIPEPNRPISKEDCKVMRSSTRSLAALRNLRPSALVLLLTPVLAPANSKADSKNEAMDPFEAFGRELSKSHKRVRHVPYRPEAGMTQTHRGFLSQAGAVVVVTCEPSAGSSESVKLQDAFAQSVAGARQALPKPEDVPFILMRFQEEDVEAGLEEYENAFRAAALNDRSVDHAAQLMFKHSI